MTIFEAKGRLAGLKLAYIGDGNNVAHSLMFAGAQLGVHVWVATPDGYEPDRNATEWAQKRAAETGGSCMITNDPVAAVKDADVIYTDVWTSMGQESEAALRRKIFLPYQVNGKLFAQAKPDTIFMHCLPAHRGDEVTDEVIDSPRSFVFQEAENRLHVIAIKLEPLPAANVFRENEIASLGLELRAQNAIRIERHLLARPTGRLHQVHLRDIAKARPNQHLVLGRIPPEQTCGTELAITARLFIDVDRYQRNFFEDQVVARRDIRGRLGSTLGKRDDRSSDNGNDGKKVAPHQEPPNEGIAERHILRYECQCSRLSDDPLVGYSLPFQSSRQT